MKRERENSDDLDLEGTPVRARHQVNESHQELRSLGVPEEAKVAQDPASSVPGFRLLGNAHSGSPSMLGGEGPASPSFRPGMDSSRHLLGGSSSQATNQLLSTLLQQQRAGDSTIDQLNLLDARLQLENQLLLQQLLGAAPLSGASSNPALPAPNNLGNVLPSSVLNSLLAAQQPRQPSLPPNQLLNNDSVLAQLLARNTVPSTAEQQIDLLRRELAISQAMSGFGGGLSDGLLSSSILARSGLSALGLGTGTGSSAPGLTIAQLTALLSDTTPADQDTAGKLPFVTADRAIPLKSDLDDEKLSPYQIKVREQLEYFVAQEEDVDSSIQGRKKQVKIGQIGIRCIHCCHIPIRCRSRGAVYYPARLNGVYQAAQNMANSHLLDSCDMIPEDARKELKRLRERGDTATGGKAYWADTCQKAGIYEIEEGLRLLPSNAYEGRTG